MYIDVLLPLSLNHVFTYNVPPTFQQQVKIGMRVVVPFGKKKIYTGIVRLIHSQVPKYPHIKEIIGFLEDNPILKTPQLQFWDWIAHYYQANIGDVYSAAIPSGLKLQSETQVMLNEKYNAGANMDEKELKILEVLKNGNQKSVSELSKMTKINDMLPTLHLLMQKQAIAIKEELIEKYHPKTEQYVKLNELITTGADLEKVFDELKRSNKQLELLMKYIDISDVFKHKRKEVSKKELIGFVGTSPAVFNALVKKNIFEIYTKEVGRLDVGSTVMRKQFQLTTEQNSALQKINEQFVHKNTILLHGVTSSGKTEVYIHLIQQMLKDGKQVLFLVPEIVLTSQLTERLRKIFGNTLGVYHSKFSDAERVEIWNNVLHNRGYNVIIGVRSSIFLPFRQLGLVIVDEEHDGSYKQQNPAPRYHARNAAIVLASMHGAKTLLGSATPSVESYYNAQIGKFGFVELNKRFQNIELPNITVVSAANAYRRKEMEGHFTPILKTAIETALTNKEQVILFQNRRGYAPYLECKACGYVPKCKQCDVSLTVHKFLHRLTCHYCGYSEDIPQRCPKCNEPTLSNKGFGTEKIEQEIKSIFPKVMVARLDLDTTRTKRSFEKIIHRFENGKIDILVGTQMVTKGLDFGKVSLVGVLNADNLLEFPDFRSHERAFQLLAQVSGRAGRKEKQGNVIIQTSDPKHPVLKQVLRHDYNAMYRTQYEERKRYHYPPFYRLIKIIIKHKKTDTLNQVSAKMAFQLRKELGSRVLGSTTPFVSYIQTYYIKEILIKIEIEASISYVKNLVQTTTENLQKEVHFKSVRFAIDVDPV